MVWRPILFFFLSKSSLLTVGKMSSSSYTLFARLLRIVLTKTCPSLKLIKVILNNCCKLNHANNIYWNLVTDSRLIRFHSGTWMDLYHLWLYCDGPNVTPFTHTLPWERVTWAVFHGWVCVNSYYMTTWGNCVKGVTSDPSHFIGDEDLCTMSSITGCWYYNYWILP